jgi:6-pyruvoyltetrahydropterin/6-carboxytetrahydropterin synthase
MLRLTREVRLSINADPQAPARTSNGHGGVPAASGLAHYFAIRITLAGTLDPASSYVRNIKEIDAQTRARAIPMLRQLVDQRSFTHARAAQGIYRALNDAWPGALLVELEIATTPYQSISVRHTEPDMIRVSQKFEFSAAHRLHNPELSDDANVATFGKCNNPHGHGHNYEVQVTLAGTPDPATGTLIPIPDLEQIVDRHAINVLDHKHLNLQVDAFRTLNPSVEHIAMVIFKMLENPLARPHCKLASVTVWETPKTWAEYGG